MNEVFNWIVSNKETLIEILTGVVTVASLVAALTPNDSDNKVVRGINKVVSWLALNVGKAKSNG